MERNTVNQPQKLGKRIDIRGFINSPWILLLAVLIVGGFYLMGHPELIQAGVNNPYAVAFILAIPICIFAVKLVLNFFTVIEQWVHTQIERIKTDKKGHLWELVIAFFMIVSVTDGGAFYNNITKNALWGLSGYASVLLLDLVSVVLINAMRIAKAKGNDVGLYLIGILLCASLSAVGNLYSGLENFQASTAKTIPGFLNQVSPYMGVAFPLLILFMALSRSVDIDVDDAEYYKKQQQKRVDFLAAKREMCALIAKEMEGIELLKQREFFLKSWLFTKAKLNLVVETVTGKVQQNISDLRKELEAKNQIIQEQVALAQQLVEQSKEQQEIIALQLESLANFQAKMDSFSGNSQVNFDQEIQEKMANFQQHFNGKIAEISYDFQAKMDEQNRHFSAKIGQELSNFQSVFAQKFEEKDTNPEIKTVQKSRTTQPLNSSGNAQKFEENEEKKLIGLTYQDAVKLLICQKKQIKISDIKAAIKSGDLKAKSDGSVARSAIENWAKDFNREEKVS